MNTHWLRKKQPQTKKPLNQKRRKSREQIQERKKKLISPLNYTKFRSSEMKFHKGG